MTWLPILLLGLAGFLGGGAWSFRREGPRWVFWALAIGAALAVVGAFVWAWEPA